MGHFLRSKPYLLASFTHSTNMYYASGTILGTGDASLNDRVKNSYPREAYDVMGGGADITTVTSKELTGLKGGKCCGGKGRRVRELV